jgi:hypothetical protein
MATVPPAPSSVKFYGITATSITYQFSSNGNGGLPILEWQIGYGTHPSKPQRSIKSSGTTTITGLQPATTYHVWARGRNKLGWGPYSVHRAERTAAGAWVKIGTVWKEAVPMMRIKGKWVFVEPWVRSGGKWHKTG